VTGSVIVVKMGDRSRDATGGATGAVSSNKMDEMSNCTDRRLIIAGASSVGCSLSTDIAESSQIIFGGVGKVANCSLPRLGGDFVGVYWVEESTETESDFPSSPVTWLTDVSCSEVGACPRSGLCQDSVMVEESTITIFGIEGITASEKRRYSDAGKCGVDA
jgi:hypothetical protein